MKIGGMGGLELVIILVVILLIFGPKNLPKLGSAIGKTVSNLRAGMNEGKKKKDDGKADAAKEEAPAEPTRAEIEGPVETVEPEPVPEPEPEAAPVPAEPEGDLVEFDEGDAEPEVGDATAVQADSAEAEGADAPKKVRRVVKKKVTSEEA